MMTQEEYSRQCAEIIIAQKGSCDGVLCSRESREALLCPCRGRGICTGNRAAAVMYQSRLSLLYSLGYGDGSDRTIEVGNFVNRASDNSSVVSKYSKRVLAILGDQAVLTQQGDYARLKESAGSCVYTVCLGISSLSSLVKATEPAPVKLTVAEIEEKLGFKIEVVSE